MEQQQLQEKKFPGSSVSVLLAMVVISTFVSSHGLTKKGFQSILDILIILLPEN